MTYVACTAVMASNKAATDVQRARKLARESYIVSTVGVVIGVIVIAVIIAQFL